MPLIVISGLPCSGKTTRANQIKNDFAKRDCTVLLISENEIISTDKFDKNEVYTNFQMEKQLRNIMKSHVIRNLNTKTVIILDALNYIKGYRYEIYCSAKSNNCTQCTIHCDINENVAWQRNLNRQEYEEKYSKELFKELVQRYECPESRNRWDSPLFTIQDMDEMPFDDIFSSLFKRTAPKPNISTKIEPKLDSQFIEELNKRTNEVLTAIFNFKKQIECKSNTEVQVNDKLNIDFDLTNVSIQQLVNLRRSFLSFSKINRPDSYESIASNFIQFLNSNLNE